MTFPARVIQFARGEVARVPERDPAFCSLVFAAGSMTGFAADSIFVGAHIAAGDLYGTGGVAVEAFRDVESLVLYAGGVH